jgi:hypothetical protein
MSAPRENWRHIGNNVYVVRTQAGFNQAIKHFWGPLCKGERRPETFGYPRKYPSLVALSVYYHGGNDVRAQCVPVNKVLEEIQASDKTE